MDSKVSDGANSGGVHFVTGGIAEEAGPLMIGRKDREEGLSFLMKGKTEKG